MAIKYNGQDVTEIRFRGPHDSSFYYPFTLVLNGTIVWARTLKFTVSLGTGVDSVTVTRTASLDTGAPLEVLTPTTTEGGSNVYSVLYGDTVSISATAKTSYTMDSYPSSITFTSNSDMSLSATKTPNWFKVWQGTSSEYTITADSTYTYTQSVSAALTYGCPLRVTLKATYSGVSNTGVLQDGNYIYPNTTQGPAYPYVQLVDITWESSTKIRLRIKGIDGYGLSIGSGSSAVKVQWTYIEANANA